MPELFQTYDEASKAQELVERGEVHRRGLWHRSSIVYLFHPDGRLYVQRRAACKDLYENKFDHSVGEHLIPGETHAQGAHRGLQEELGLTNIDLKPLGNERSLRVELPEHGIKDYEFQQAYTGTYAGKMHLDAKEVAEVKLFTIEELAVMVEQHPDLFTPWFGDDLGVFGFLPRKV